MNGIIRILLLGLFALILFSCSAKQETFYAEVDTMVGALNTDEDKKVFLENIFDKDQSVRDSEKSAQIVMTYGKDSKEDMEYVKAQWRQDEINLVKVETYIKKYGYPSKIELSEYAALAPWIVIHHSSDIEIRNRNFKHLYRAYLNENIDDNALAMYLGRTYRFMNREDFYIASPFMPDDEINGLIKALGFEKEKLSILQSIAN